MKLKQLFENNMSAEEIESTLDDIQSEYGKDSKVKKMIKTVTNLLVKKDMPKATEQVEALMDYVRTLNDE
jgi:polyhydroxyalkanoate synthesis regulator phasin